MIETKNYKIISKIFSLKHELKIFYKKKCY